MTDKYIENGNVAVIYSGSYGAGWSTWNTEKKFHQKMIFDTEIVKILLDDSIKNKVELILEHVELKYKNACLLASDELAIEWIPIGTLFRINEYDGAESVEIFDKKTYLKA